MGISLTEWRSVIGRYCHSNYSQTPNSSENSARASSLGGSLLSNCLKLAVLLSLLVIGGVELNPGPKLLLKCHFCDLSFTLPAQYSNHQGLHAITRNFQFKCALCPFKTTTPRYLATHISRTHVKKMVRHPSQPQPLALPSSSYVQCTFLGCEVKVSSVKELSNHLCGHIRNGETIDCPLGLCSKPEKPERWVSSFSKVNNFRSHMNKYHKTATLPIPQAFPSHQVSAGLPLQSPDSSVCEDLPGEEFEETSQLDTEPFSTNEVCDYIAKFYLKLEADLLLPASTIQVIADELTKIVNFCHPIVKKTLMKELANLKISEEDAERVAFISLTDDPLYRVHSKNFGSVCLSSSHLRHQFYKSNYQFEKPEKVQLKVEGNKHIHRVSVRSSLALQLQDPLVQVEIDNSLKKLPLSEKDEPQIYSDFTDGEVFRNHPASKEKSLFLIFFWDAFGVNNPLGSAKNTHKTVGVYYVIGNLPPEKRSRVDILQLNALFLESHFKTEELDVCLAPTIEELEDLMKNKISYKGLMLPVYLLFVLGDNLGAHQIGGFVKSFSGEYWCRFCVISKKEFQANPCLLPYNLRTIDEYEQFAEKVKNENLKSYKGINFSSILNTLLGFHVCLPALAPCLAHDLFEGCFAFDMMLIIKYFIKEKWFTREQFNKALKAFKFTGSDAADIPATLELGKNKKLKAKLTGSAVKNWNMIRFFSLIVHDFVVDVDNPVWKLYLLMKVICEIVCAPQITSDDITRLDFLISSYLELRKNLFPNTNLKPKHHFLRHYPVLIKKFGPLIRLFTLRMEHHHYLLKRCARACNNFKDVTYTMAFKSQLRKAYLSIGSLFQDEFTYTVPQTFDPLWEQHVVEFINKIQLPESSVCVKTVSINGTKYSCGLWLLIGRQESTLIVGKIIAIFCHTVVDFVVEQYTSTVEANDYGLHEINFESSLGLGHVSSLKRIESYYPLPAYIVSEKYVLSLKHSTCAQEIF